MFIGAGSKREERGVFWFPMRPDRICTLEVRLILRTKNSSIVVLSYALRNLGLQCLPLRP